METDPEVVLPHGDAARLWAKAASRTAAVALVFCGVVLALLLVNASIIKSSTPYNHQGMASMMEQLQAADQAHRAAEVSRLVSGIRDLDASARSQFFRAHAGSRHGESVFVNGYCYTAAPSEQNTGAPCVDYAGCACAPASRGVARGVLFGLFPHLLPIRRIS